MHCIETFFNISLYSKNITLISQNFKQFIITQKVKSWESMSLFFQQIIQCLLNVIKWFFMFPPFLLRIFFNALSQQSKFISEHHLFLEIFIYLLKKLGLIFQFIFNFLTRENIFQIHPIFLNNQPIIQSFLRKKYTFLQNFHIITHFFQVPWT